MIAASLAPIASHLWQSTLFAAVAGLLTVALRRNQARVRYWVWLAASYKFLIPFSWLVSVGHLVQWRAAPPIMSPTFSAVTGVVSGPDFLTVLPATKSTPDHFNALLFTVCVVWACGFVIVAAGWFREWLRIRAVVRTASPLSLGLPIRVVSTPARLEPGVFGIFHPVLLLPEGIATRLTSAQLQAVIAHELCHVRRRDNLAAAAHMLVEALFWFHPLVWWLGARIVEEREHACDEEVLKAGSQAQAYAESILKVCEFYLGSSLTCVPGVTGSDLKKRIQRIMKNHFGVALSPRKKLLLATAGITALAVPLMGGVLIAPHSRAQTAATDWQTVAGGKMKFDVASVKENKSGSGDKPSSNFNLSMDDSYHPTGGLFSATNEPLSVYIVFAYKLNLFQAHALRSQLPRWANANGYDIEARVVGKPTKDQMRMMVQSLLADRFKLKVHHDAHQGPVFALVLVKPGKTGPKLQPAVAPCVERPNSQTAPPTTLPLCGFEGHFESGLVHVAGRSMTVPFIASQFVGGWGGNFDRPILDETGLSGNFDFSIEFAPLPSEMEGTPPGSQADPAGPSLLEALKDQLGLKLQSQAGPVESIVVDHVEQPSEN